MSKITIKPDDEPIENGHEIIMDETDALHLAEREAREKALAWFKRAFRILVQYDGNKTMAIHALALALDWGDLIECESAVDVAVKLFSDKKKKAAVSKCENIFIDVLGLLPTNGQRSKQGRNAMTKARKKQLK